MAMDLESEEAPASTTPPVENPAPPAELPPQEPPDPDVAQAVEVQGGQYVPLPALKASRAEVKELKAKVAEIDALRQQLAHTQGTLQTYQQVQQHLQQQPAAPAGPQADPELVEIARSLDYYKGDGTPDLDRAAKFSALIERKAESKARAMVGPLQEQTAQDLSLRNYQAASQEKTPSGMAIDQNLLRTLWGGLPASYTADPRVARIIASTVLGEQARMAAPLVPPPPNPPLHTENVGGSVTPRRTPISDAEKKVLEHRGMKEEEYAKVTKDFRSGRMNTLED